MNNERIKQAMAQLATLNAKIASNSACNASSEENHANAIEIVLDALQSFLELGITPEQIREIDKLYAQKCKELAEEKKKHRWIPCSEQIPEDDKYILMSFENYSLPLVGRYGKDCEMGGAFYIGDCDGDDTCIANNLFVNAWRPLPDPYREETE